MRVLTQEQFDNEAQSSTPRVMSEDEFNSAWKGSVSNLLPEDYTEPTPPPRKVIPGVPAYPRIERQAPEQPEMRSESAFSQKAKDISQSIQSAVDNSIIGRGLNLVFGPETAAKQDKKYQLATPEQKAMLDEVRKDTTYEGQSKAAKLLGVAAGMAADLPVYMLAGEVLPETWPVLKSMGTFAVPDAIRSAEQNLQSEGIPKSPMEAVDMVTKAVSSGVKGATLGAILHNVGKFTGTMTPEGKANLDATIRQRVGDIAAKTAVFAEATPLQERRMPNLEDIISAAVLIAPMEVRSAIRTHGNAQIQNILKEMDRKRVAPTPENRTAWDTMQQQGQTHMPEPPPPADTRSDVEYLLDRVQQEQQAIQQAPKYTPLQATELQAGTRNAGIKTLLPPERPVTEAPIAENAPPVTLETTLPEWGYPTPTGQEIVDSGLSIASKTEGIPPSEPITQPQPEVTTNGQVQGQGRQEEVAAQEPKTVEYSTPWGETRQAPVRVPKEDIPLFSKLASLSWEFNAKRKPTKTRQSEIIQRSEEIRRELSRKGYDNQFLADVGMYAPVPLTEQTIEGPKPTGNIKDVWYRVGDKNTPKIPKSLQEQFDYQSNLLKPQPQPEVTPNGEMQRQGRQEEIAATQQDLLKQMVEDQIATYKSKGAKVPEHLIKKQAELSGVSLSPDEVAGAQVFGHPQSTNIMPQKYGNLIPIKASSAEAIDGKIAKAQKLVDELQSRLVKRKGSKPLSFEEETVLDLLRTETMPELYRMAKSFEPTPSPEPTQAGEGVVPNPPEVKIAKYEDGLKRDLKGQAVIGKLDAEAKREWLRERGRLSHDTGRKLRYEFHLSDGRVVSAEGALKATNPKAYDRLKQKHQNLASEKARLDIFNELPEEVRNEMVSSVDANEIAQNAIGKSAKHPDPQMAVDKYLRENGHMLSGVWGRTNEGKRLLSEVYYIISAEQGSFSSQQEARQKWNQANKSPDSQISIFEKDGKHVATLSDSDKAKTLSKYGWNKVSEGKAVGEKLISTPPAVTKQPWEMTREEFIKSGPNGYGEDGGIGWNPEGTEHRIAIDIALDSGKPVPPEVLADYPDLQEKYNASNVRSDTRQLPEQPKVPKQGQEETGPARVNQPSEQDLSRNGVQQLPKEAPQRGEVKQQAQGEVEYKIQFEGASGNTHSVTFKKVKYDDLPENIKERVQNDLRIEGQYGNTPAYKDLWDFVRGKGSKYLQTNDLGDGSEPSVYLQNKDEFEQSFSNFALPDRFYNRSMNKSAENLAKDITRKKEEQSRIEEEQRKKESAESQANYEAGYKYRDRISQLSLPAGKVQDIPIVLDDGTKSSRKMTVYNGVLGISKEGEGKNVKYRLNHVKSGLAFPKEYKSLSDAQLSAKAILNSGVDLSKETVEPKEVSKLRPIIQFFTGLTDKPPTTETISERKNSEHWSSKQGQKAANEFNRMAERRDTTFQPESIPNATLTHDVVNNLIQMNEGMKAQGKTPVFPKNQEGALRRKFGDFPQGPESSRQYAEKIAKAVLEEPNPQDSKPLTDAVNKFRGVLKKTYGVGWKKEVASALEHKMPEELPPSYGSDNTLVTKEDYDAAKGEFGKLRIKPNPEAEIKALGKIVLYHVESLTRSGIRFVKNDIWKKLKQEVPDAKRASFNRVWNATEHKRRVLSSVLFHEKENKARQEGVQYGRAQIPHERGEVWNWVVKNMPGDYDSITKLAIRVIQAKGTVNEPQLVKELEARKENVLKQVERRRLQEQAKRDAQDKAVRESGMRYGKALEQWRREELLDLLNEKQQLPDNPKDLARLQEMIIRAKPTIKSETLQRKAENMLSRIAAKREQQGAIAQLKNSISTALKSRLMPEQQQQLNALLSGIQLRRPKDETLAKAQELLDFVKNDDLGLISKEQIAKAQSLLDKASGVQEGTVSDLRSMHPDEISKITAEINHLIDQSTWQHIIRVAQRKMEKIQDTKQMVGEIHQNALKTYTGESQVKAGPVFKYNQSIIDMPRLVKKLFGPGTKGQEIIDTRIVAGVNEMIRQFQKAGDYMRKVVAEIQDVMQFSDMLTGIEVQRVPFKLESGQTLNLTPAEVGTFYLHWKDDGKYRTQDQMLAHGISTGKRRNKTIFKITENDARNILSYARMHGIDTIAQKLSAFVNDKGPDGMQTRLNAAALENKGVVLATGDNHWSRKRDKDFDITRDTVDRQMNHFIQGRLDSAGPMQERTGDVTPVIVSDMFSDFLYFARQQEAYVNLHRPVQDARDILSRAEILNAINDHFPGEGNRPPIYHILNRFIDETAGLGYRERGPIEGILRRIGRNAIRSALKLKPWIVMYQRASLMKAAGYVDGKYLFTPESHTGLNEAVQYLKDHSPYLRDRFDSMRFAYNMEGFGINLREFYGTNMLTRKEKLFGYLDDFGMKWMHNADSRTIAIFFKAKMQEGRAKGLSGQELSNYAVKEAENWTRLTQASYMPMDISLIQLEAESSFAKKLFVMFKSEQIKNYNMMQEAVDDFQHGRISNAEFTQRFAVQAGMQMVISAIQYLTFAVPSLIKKDEDSDKWAQRAIMTLVNNSFSMVPFAGELAGTFVMATQLLGNAQGLDEVQPNVVQATLQDITSAARAVTHLTDKNGNIRWSSVNRILRATDRITGIGIAGLSKQIEWLVNMMSEPQPKKSKPMSLGFSSVKTL